MLFAVLLYFPFLLFSKRLWKPEFHVQRLNSSGLPGMWTLFVQGVRSHASIFDGADQMADLNFKQSKIPYGWNPACIFRKLLCMPFLCHRLDELHEEHFQNMQLFDALLMHVTSPLAPDSRILITCTSQKTVPPKSIPFRLQPIQSILPYTHTHSHRAHKCCSFSWPFRTLLTSNGNKKSTLQPVCREWCWSLLYLSVSSIFCGIHWC